MSQKMQSIPQEDCCSSKYAA